MLVFNVRSLSYSGYVRAQCQVDLNGSSTMNIKMLFHYVVMLIFGVQGFCGLKLSQWSRCVATDLRLNPERARSLSLSALHIAGPGQCANQRSCTHWLHWFHCPFGQWWLVSRKRQRRKPGLLNPTITLNPFQFPFLYQAINQSGITR